VRVLLNTTNLVKGGALQVATALIAEILADPQDIDWHFALSSNVRAEVRKLTGRLPSNSIEFPASPAKDRVVRREVLALADRLQPDAVFTVFGPAFVQFRQLHLLGCATPWVTNSTWLSYQTLPTLREKLHMWGWSQYCGWWLRQADAWVTESPAVQDGMWRRLKLPKEQIGVVSNSCSQPYFTQAQRTPFPAPGQKIRLLCFSAPYVHKCIDLIPQTAAALAARLPHCDFEFVVTLPHDDALWHQIDTEARRLGVARRVVNRGPIAVADGPALYRDCHVCFMPTVLECFTATYPEAMAMGLPIVTSDLDFARAVCDDAALYFPPRNPPSAAEQLQRLLTSPTEWTRLVDRGKQVLQGLPKPRQKYDGYVALLERLVKGEPLVSEAPTSETLRRRAA
jgi:glycosyltransferase involved in cell wall biosynthesis